MVLVKKTELFSPAGSTPPRTLTRDALHAISTEFLSSEKLLHAPLSEKKEFLKTKGLSGDEIEVLLKRAAAKVKGTEVVRVPLPASSSSSSPPSSSPTSDAGRVAAGENKKRGESKGSEDKRDEDKRDEDKRSEDRSIVPQALREIKPSAPTSSLQPTTMEPQMLQQPLIVTYPEFLAPPPQPPAPITATSLVTGMYYSAALATTIYGGSKYILQPMYDQLTAARAELAQTTLNNLTQFNDKLSALVPSHVRPAIPPTRSANDIAEDEALIVDGEDDSSDAASIASSSNSSLRTHLFHVDASTQTMPDPLSSPPPQTPTSEEKIATISTHLTTLIDSNSDGADGELQYELEALTTYLETLRVDVGNRFPWGGGGSATPAAAAAGGKEDLTQTVKREIRSVKGVFLNSKNFPGAR